jgi:transcriptional regulator with XRE-family HTH domain
MEKRGENMGLEKIAKLKKELNITTEELSKKSGVPIGTLNKILSGVTKDPKLETLKSLARVLNCTLDDFDDENVNKKLKENEIILISNFNKLNDLGKKEANKRIFELSQIKEYTKESKEYLMPVAAHDKEGNFSEEDLINDMKIMEDDNFWNN